MLVVLKASHNHIRYRKKQPTRGMAWGSGFLAKSRKYTLKNEWGKEKLQLLETKPSRRTHPGASGRPRSS